MVEFFSTRFNTYNFDTHTNMLQENLQVLPMNRHTANRFFALLNKQKLFNSLA